MQKEISTAKNPELEGAILSCIGDGIIATDLKGRVIYMNHIAEAITGRASEDAIGKDADSILNVINANTKEPLKPPIRYVIENDTIKGLVRDAAIMAKGNMPRYVSATCSSIKGSDGAIIGAVMIIRDITRLRTLEIDHLKEKEAAEAANKAKSEFLANMSHEIRTPINGMLGMVDLTLLTALNNEQKDNLLTAKACANSLLAIINEILDFSKLEAGKMSVENENIDIHQLIEEIIKTHTPRVAEKGLELNYSFSSTIPRYLIGDRKRLCQVLNNLISNAIKFTDSGNISVGVKKITGIGDEVELRFSVSDTGIGIAAEDIGRLFKSFSQVDGSFTKRFGGTGLGLVISKQFVEMMGGRIWVESEKGKGTRFYFTLVFNIGEKPQESERELSQIAPAQNPLRILLVDDDTINQKVIMKMLQGKGHRVELSGNGEEALTTYETGKYDVILMDIQMPGMDGIETARRIKEMEGAGNHTPIIALTAYALKGDRERYLAMGMDEYVSKPIDMFELFATIDSVSVTKQDRKGLIPDKVTLGENGGIAFAYHITDHLREKRVNAVSKIGEYIETFEGAIEKNDYMAVEGIAHSVKTTSKEYDFTEIENTAFKIVLAIRRGSFDEAVIYIENIKSQYKTLKKYIAKGSNDI